MFQGPASFGMLQVVFLVAATGITVGVEASLFRWPGGRTWKRALAAAALGLIPIHLALFGSLWFVGTDFFAKKVAWTMVVFLPVLGFLLVLSGSFLVKVEIQCRFGGLLPGLLVNLLVFPMLLALYGSTRPSLWSLLEGAWPPADLAEAVVRRNHRYLSRHLDAAKAPEVLGLAIREGDPRVAALALERGADPNEPIRVTPYPSARTPLVHVLEASGSPGEESGRRELLRVLLEHGADPDRPSPKVVYYASSPDAGKFETPRGIAQSHGDPDVLAALDAAGRGTSAKAKADPGSQAGSQAGFEPFEVLDDGEGVCYPRFAGTWAAELNRSIEALVERERADFATAPKTTTEDDPPSLGIDFVLVDGPPHLVGVLLSIDRYLGGPHGDSRKVAFPVVRREGRRLSLADLVTVGEGAALDTLTVLANKKLVGEGLERGLHPPPRTPGSPLDHGTSRGPGVPPLRRRAVPGESRGRNPDRGRGAAAGRPARRGARKPLGPGKRGGRSDPGSLTEPFRSANAPVSVSTGA